MGDSKIPWYERLSGILFLFVPLGVMGLLWWSIAREGRPVVGEVVEAGVVVIVTVAIVVGQRFYTKWKKRNAR